MDFKTFQIQGPILITPKKHIDARGYFMESFRQDWFNEHIEDVNFVQSNQSYSEKSGTIRGLHFQKHPFEQGKLVSCIKGKIFDVAVDIRPNSPNYKKWISAELSSDNDHQLWIPPGFAHGFCTLEDECIIVYKVTNYYKPEYDANIAYNDDEIGIKWPLNAPAILSQKDKAAPKLSEIIE